MAPGGAGAAGTAAEPAADARDRAAAATAVVTGIGLAAPTGLSLADHWAATLDGRSGLGLVEDFDAAAYPSRVVGRAHGFVDAERIPSRLLPQTDRVTRLALHAAREALLDAGVDPADGFDEYRMGVVLSNGQGGFAFTHGEFRKLWSQGPEYVSVYESFAWFYACNTGQISIRHALRGPSAALVGDQAGGLDAIGVARRAVRRGTALVLTGGLDSALDPWGYASQLAPGETSRSNEPGRAYLPFAAAASGSVPGEGGAVLVLEDAAAAAAAGRPAYGSISGYCATFDPAPGSGRPPALERAVRGAIADAGLRPADVDVVFADATGVPERDTAEARALVSVFGLRGVPVTAPKTLTGRLCAGGGPLDAATALLALRAGVIPPTGHREAPAAQHGIDLVQRARTGALRHALVLARGRGGFNSALLVSAP
jgi:minimal PKS chain-length factor (CLF/KS beta)